MRHSRLSQPNDCPPRHPLRPLKMAEEKVISQLKERVAFLEGLVMSLVAKNEPRADSTTTQANTDSADNVEAAPTITEETSEEQVPFLINCQLSSARTFLRGFSSRSLQLITAASLRRPYCQSICTPVSPESLQSSKSIRPYV